MRHHLTAFFLPLVLVLSVCSSCKTRDERAACALARRVLGDKASVVRFEQTDSPTDCYELTSKGTKVLIRGNNANSMAVGLNRYIQEYCLANVSWYDFNPVELPETLPLVEGSISANAEMPVRFFLNYCTFGYTMPWWGWKQWERFIDWMALNGVNMPLAITGEEAVWQKVWRKYGLSDEQIRSFFTGPAHLPWQRMCNIDRWQGPLPQSWIDGQAKLQKRILRRERSLNMTPVLPAFSGHIPAELNEAVPDSLDCSPVRRWCGFAEQYRCTFLSPTDPLFARIQKDYLEEQTRMYGTDHIYGVDCFNEVPPPSWDPEYLARVSAGVYDSMASVDPDAVWLQMGWLFISSRRNWTPERIKAYLTAVPQGRMMLLDYESDYLEIWRQTESFYGQPFIWCYLGNFGNMTEIEGDYYHNDRLIAGAKEEGGPGFVGLGCTLEGFGVNESVYEAVLSRAWSNSLPSCKYIDNIADRHLGRVDSVYRKYWHALADNVCITHTSTSASNLICARPSLEGVRNSNTVYDRGYDIRYLDEAMELLDQVEGTSDYYRFDVANARRQAISNKAPALRERFAAAYKAGDRAGMLAARDEFLALCDDLIAVVGTRPEFSLDDWIRDARSWGKTEEEKDYFEMNARTIISVWGDSFRLCDYANRDWDGLIETYYKPRWQMFFDAVIAAFDAGEEYIDRKSPRALQFDKDCWDFECRWAHIPTCSSSGSNPLKTAGSFYVYDSNALTPTTEAPEGYEPFYVSHFARHGARWCTSEYENLHACLLRASEVGVLTDSGKEFFSRYESFYQKARLCSGNLTQVGQKQHRGIAERLFERFPEVFDGPTHVEAVSTESPRVIMSMWSCLSGLQARDKDIEFVVDASSKHASWLQPSLRLNPYLKKGSLSVGEAVEKAHGAYFDKTVPWKQIALRFFTGEDVIADSLKTTPMRFIEALHAVVSDTKCCLDADRDYFDGVLSADEMYSIWKAVSAKYFYKVARFEGSESLTLDYAAFTLEQIIESADADIASGDTQLRLRFGHDSGIAPLLVVLDANGYGRATSSFEESLEIFPDYNLPMGASAQFVFYRNDAGNILFKLLVNEQEATLPLRPVQGPYYSWSGFKKHYLPIIRASKRKIANS